MTAETKLFIEKHIHQIENNGITSAYLDCPLSILNEFNNILHKAGIDYPPVIHNYVVVCCYIANMFKDVILQSYDFEYSTEKETYEFNCYNCLYLFEQLHHDLSELLPKRNINVEIAQQLDFSGMTSLNIRVEVK